jgi:hypothetical protein
MMHGARLKSGGAGSKSKMDVVFEEKAGAVGLKKIDRGR